MEHIRRGVISVKSTVLQFYCQATSSRRKGLMLSKVSRQFSKMQTLLRSERGLCIIRCLVCLQSQHLLANFLTFQQPNANLLDFEQQIVCHIEYASPMPAISWSYSIFCHNSNVSLPGLHPFLLIIGENITYLSWCRSRFGWTLSWSSRRTESLVWKLFVTDFTQFRW